MIIPWICRNVDLNLLQIPYPLFIPSIQGQSHIVSSVVNQKSFIKKLSMHTGKTLLDIVIYYILNTLKTTRWGRSVVKGVQEQPDIGGCTELIIKTCYFTLCFCLKCNKQLRLPILLPCKTE